MRSKKLLAAFLLGVGLCFVPTLGYGEIKTWMDESKATAMDLKLLEASLNYIMTNPTTFWNVSFHYDSIGTHARVLEFPRGVSTKDKIVIQIYDNRDGFSYKTGIALLDLLKRGLETAYSFVEPIATNMDTDIVAKFHSRGSIPLGYFYQRGYHLWEK